MEGKQVKKLYILYILKILEKYSDCNHRLTQQDIIKLMEKEYGVSCERKTVSRNISDLADAGYEIERRDGGYYLDSRPFEDSELRLLIDSVIASRHIPARQAADLVDKLMGQSSVYFKNSLKHIYSLDKMEHEESNDLFWNLECIGEAIDRNRKIAFYYNKYGEDKKLHHTTEKEHVVNPYYIAIANGRYYLVANNDRYRDITHFRLEKISGARILEEARKPKEEIEEFKGGEGLSKHMVERVYMFSGSPCRVVMKVSPEGINDAIDWLGRDIRIEKKDGSVFFIKRTHQFFKFTVAQSRIADPLVREHLCRIFPAVFPDDVNTFVDQNPDQPCPEIPFLFEIAEGTVTGFNGILNGISDIFLIGKIAPGHFIHTLFICFYQFYESLGITLTCSFYKVFQRNPLLVFSVAHYSIIHPLF